MDREPRIGKQPAMEGTGDAMSPSEQATSEEATRAKSTPEESALEATAVMSTEHDDAADSIRQASPDSKDQREHADTDAGTAARQPKFQLGTQVQFVPGVGAARAPLFVKIGLPRAGDLLFYFPRDYLPPVEVVPFAKLKPDM